MALDIFFILCPGPLFRFGGSNADEAVTGPRPEQGRAEHSKATRPAPGDVFCVRPLAYDDLLFLVLRYCRELRFTLHFGINLGQVVKPPEGALFAHFLNHLGNDRERQQVWQLFQDVEIGLIWTSSTLSAGGSMPFYARDWEFMLSCPRPPPLLPTRLPLAPSTSPQLVPNVGSALQT